MWQKVFFYQQIRAKTDVRVPQIFYSDFSCSLLPSAFFIMEKLQGQPLTACRLSGAERTAMHEQIGEPLAQLAHGLQPPCRTADPAHRGRKNPLCRTARLFRSDRIHRAILPLPQDANQIPRKRYTCKNIAANGLAVAALTRTTSCFGVRHTAISFAQGGRLRQEQNADKALTEAEKCGMIAAES